MKKILLFSMMLVLSMSSFAKQIYLNAGGSSLWDKDGAKFAVWHWQGSGEGSWSAFMVKEADGIYSAEIADASNKVIFVRMNSDATKPDWEKYN